MSDGMVTLRERLHRSLATVKKAREGAKEMMTEVIGTVVGGATSFGLGALDEAKGSVMEGDSSGIRTYNVGPVPASLLAAGAGKLGALVMMGDGLAPVVSQIGQAGVNAASYVAGRRAYAAYEENQKKESKK